MASQWHETRSDGETYHRRGQFIYPIRPGACTPARNRTNRQKRDRKIGLLRRRVQHYRHRRRHSHGARWHALLITVARPHRRQRGIYGQRPQSRRYGVHQQLRQNHPGHAHGRHAAEYSHHIRIGRSYGSREPE